MNAARAVRGADPTWMNMGRLPMPRAEPVRCALADDLEASAGLFGEFGEPGFDNFGRIRVLVDVDHI